MSEPHSRPEFLELPEKRPVIQRGYTSSPPDRHICTPPISHGFIPLGTSTPLPTLAGHDTNRTGSDYFMLPRKENVMSPDAVKYESHGFIPLCSVAAVEEDKESKDYFFRLAVREPGASIGSTPADVFGKNPSELEPEVYHHDSSHANQVSSERLTEDALAKLELNDESLHTRIWRLERSVLGLSIKDSTENRFDATQAAHAAALIGHVDDSNLERRPSCCSILSATSPSEYSNEAESAMLVEDTESRQFAETISLPGSSSRKGEDKANESQENNALWYDFPANMEMHALGVCANQMRPIETVSEMQQTTQPSSLPTPSGAQKQILSEFRAAPSSSLTVHRYAISTPAQVLASLLSGPKIDIVNGTTGEVFVSTVPERMLIHFCGQEDLQRLLPESYASQGRLEIPSSEAEKEGIVRVIRFMRRSCSPKSHATSGHLRIPQGSTYLKDGMETVRACRVLGLHADAERLQQLVVRNLVLSVNNVDQVWNRYFGSMRNTAFGDAVVWFILQEIEKDQFVIRDELMCLLEHNSFRELKERVREEIRLRMWTHESREQYLNRRHNERKSQVETQARLRENEQERSKKAEERCKENKQDQTEHKKEKYANSSRVEPVYDGHDNRNSIRPTMRKMANFFGFLDTNKPLLTPSPGLKSSSNEDKIGTAPESVTPTSHLYADYVHSLPSPRSSESISQKSSASAIRGNFSVSGSTLSNAWEDPRPAPVPRKKPTLWERVKIVFNE